MRFFLKFVLVIAALGGMGWAASKPAKKYLEERNRPVFRTADVSSGEIVSVVNSTGTIKPVLSVQIGSFVSGPIEELYVDFNDEVKKDDLLARIDPRIYQANVARDRATLAARKADIERARAQLQQAINDEQRAIALQADNKNFISNSEMDQFKFNRMALDAQLLAAQAAQEQADASLKNSEANLAYTEIRSPVDGIVIDRKIDPGQTLAAQFQTPELFIVAPQMREEMHVFASVDEADIGLIRDAKDAGQPVNFTVDAYPDDLFSGVIFQIRMSSTTTQNVVTYPVVVSAPNSELKLLPGMTASLSFQIERKTEIVRIPNAALRFYPQREHVHPDDHKILEGAERDNEDSPETANLMMSAADKAEAGRQRNRRHVWITEDHLLRAVEIVTGLSDNKFTELISGDVREGQVLVTGVKPKK